MLSVDATRIRFDDFDHENHDTAAASSGGREIRRIISRERVARIVSFEERIAAIYAPLGLGRD